MWNQELHQTQQCTTIVRKSGLIHRTSLIVISFRDRYQFFFLWKLVRWWRHRLDRFIFQYFPSPGHHRWLCSDLFSLVLFIAALVVLILSFHLFLCLPCLLLAFTVPCRIVFPKPKHLEIMVCIKYGKYWLNDLLLYVHGKRLWSCQDGQLTWPHYSWAGLDLLSG